MKILMVLDKEFPPDNRVEKEAISLVNNGNEVHLVCYARKKNYLKEENYKGIFIHRIWISKIMYKLSAAVLILPFYFWFWKKTLIKLHKEYIFEVVHIHDLPLSKLGYFFKKKYGIKLVCDQHEYYSNWIIHTAHYNSFPGIIIKAFSPWKSYEKKYLRKADLVITVEKPLKKIYINNYNITEDKIICAPNTPTKNNFNLKNVDKNFVKQYDDYFIILYTGGIDILRGIETAIAALPSIIKKIPNAKLLLVGKIIKPMNPLKIAKKYGVQNYLELIRQQPIKKLPSYVAASDVCFFTPLLNREEIQNTIATKIYEYIAMGKPVIVSNARMMKEFVEKYKIGYIIKDGDSSAFADKAISIYSNKSYTQKLQDNALKTSKEFFWDETVKPLLSFYNNRLS